MQELIRRKTRLVEVHSEVADFGAYDQKMIHRIAERNSLEMRWEWNGRNLGKYLAQGMTHMQDLDLIVEFSDQNAAAFRGIVGFDLPCASLALINRQSSFLIPTSWQTTGPPISI